MAYLRAFGTILGFCICVSVTSFAQVTIEDLSDLPTGREASPPFTDTYLALRPALALNGFDCEENGLDCNHGYGLKQILQALAAPSTEQTALIEGVLALAAEPLEAPRSRLAITHNTQRAQVRAFVALATLVLEQNGYTANDMRDAFGLPSPSEAFDRVTEVTDDLTFVQLAQPFEDEGSVDDAVKWTSALANLARFLDLHMALERAYIHYFGDASALHSCSEKQALLAFFQDQIREVDRLGNRKVGLKLPFGIRNINYDEVQAGNWPLKVHVAVGYASLAQQMPEAGVGCEAFAVDDRYEHWVRRAFRSAGKPAGENRSNHWFYQTHGGQSFWGEGPYYFNYALATIVPFWQAVRARTLLDLHPDFSVKDPFRSDWFLRPIEWMADLSTPEGWSPPLEDGNKHPIDAAYLLRWSPAYGAAGVGEKYAWIAAQLPLPSDDLLLNALSLPIGQSQAPPLDALTPASDSHHQQQIVLRRDGGTGSCMQSPDRRTSPCHYVLLNGERGKSIGRGEGHEQSDQLQLLYYVDDTSYLVDGGYDEAPSVENSTWGAYGNHNVMTVRIPGAIAQHGGLPGPYVNPFCPCMAAAHASVGRWAHQRHGRIDHVRASIELTPLATNDDEVPVEYERELLFVDDRTAPYLVDINRSRPRHTDVLRDIQFAMQYHGNAGKARELAQGAILWEGMWGAPADAYAVPKAGNSQFFVQSFVAEHETARTLATGVVREPFIRGFTRGDGMPVHRLEIRNVSTSRRSLATVAFLQPLPAGADTSFLQTRSFPREVAAMEADPDLSVYAWTKDAATIDVVALRRMGGPANRVQATFEIVPGAVSVVTLQEGVDVGFARLERTDAAWTQASGYATPGSSVAFGTSVGRQQPANGEGFVLGPIYPNPVVDRATIVFSTAHAQRIRGDVYDVLGRRVAVLIDTIMPSGHHQVVWRAAGSPSGTYFIRLLAGDHAALHQVQLSR